jgi:hypothetical protein
MQVYCWFGPANAQHTIRTGPSNRQIMLYDVPAGELTGVKITRLKRNCAGLRIVWPGGDADVTTANTFDCRKRDDVPTLRLGRVYATLPSVE